MKIPVSVGPSVMLPLVLAVALGACGTGSTPASGSTAAAATPTPIAAASAQVVQASPLPAEPPAASLATEGGDPIIGQLGTYTWGETGSDAPWLPGAPIAAATGEPLAITLDPDVAIAAWQARRVPSSADGPDGAIAVGSGVGEPTMTAPEPGSWTLVVAVEFAGGAGTANYFWQLDVR